MRKFSRKINENRGLTLVEVVVATAIILTLLLGLLGARNLYLKTAFSTGRVIKAAGLVEEGLEAVRFLRDSSWNANIAPLFLGTPYQLIFKEAGWEATTSKIWIDSLFERKIIFSPVYRDSSADIVSSGGTLDPNTLMVVSSVSWLDGVATTTKSVSTYLTNLFNN